MNQLLDCIERFECMVDPDQSKLDLSLNDEKAINFAIDALKFKAREQFAHVDRMKENENLKWQVNRWEKKEMKRASCCVANEKEVEKLRGLLAKCLDVLGSEEFQRVMVMSSVSGTSYVGPLVDLDSIREILGKGAK